MGCERLACLEPEEKQGTPPPKKKKEKMKKKSQDSCGFASIHPLATHFSPPLPPPFPLPHPRAPRQSEPRAASGQERASALVLQPDKTKRQQKKKREKNSVNTQE